MHGRQRLLVAAAGAIATLVSSGASAAEYRLGFGGCPRLPLYLREGQDRVDLLGTLETPEGAARVRAWTVGVIVEGAELVSEQTFGDPDADPPGRSGIDFHIPTVVDDDGDPETPPVDAGDVNPFEDGLGSIEPAAFSGEPSGHGLLSTVVLDAPGGRTLPPSEMVVIFRIALRVEIGTPVTVRYVDGLEGANAGPVANGIETEDGIAAPELGVCSFDVLLDPRRLDLSVVPESDAVLPELEGDFAVLEKTLPSGPQQLTCLLRLGTEGLDADNLVQGWSLSARHDPALTIPSRTTPSGCKAFRDDPMTGLHVQTLFDDDADPATPAIDPYEFDLGNSDFKTSLLASDTTCSGLPDDTAPGLIAAAVLSFQQRVLLAPNTIQPILRVRYELEVQEGPNPDLHIWYEDGMTAPHCSCPVTNIVTLNGASFEPTTTRGLILRLTGEGSWPRRFVRGDTNGDGHTDVSDAIMSLGFLFLHEPPSLLCRKSADTDDSGRIDITDPVALLNFQYLGGPAPAEPFPECGLDVATPDELTCESLTACR